jgi:hypothetical protein
MANKQLQPTNVDINYIVPTVAVDGNVIFINNENVPTITFFQARKQDGDKVSVDAVASVRFNNIDDLKNLQKAIEDTVSRHSTKEP